MQPLSELTHTLDSSVAQCRTAPTMPYDIRAEIDWIDFSCTANPLGVPARVRQAIGSAIAEGDLSFVPDAQGSHLAAMLGRYYESSEGCFLAGTSTASMIRQVAQAFRTCDVAVTLPAPADYLVALGNAGHNVIKLSNPFSLSAMDPSMAHAHDLRFSAAVLANPSYPSGRLLSEDILLKYLDECDWVIVDESNINLTLGGDSFVGLVANHPNLFVLRSISIDLGMPGIPLGYIVGNPETIAHLRHFSDGGELGLFHEVVARQLPRLFDYEQRTQELLDSEIPWMQCMLSLVVGVKVHPSEANFVMCTLEERAARDFGLSDAATLVLRLQKAGYSIRDLTGTPGVEGSRSFLVAVRSHEENVAFLAALKEAMFD
ncbi:MAG: aminotransferase class I/II-fold pyridoxal phosphate-dependent enzyme [Coriobacteriia bacterium]|nr:aminotransferase class I/II-fold pyridoxal phosphate-dependent enzyme [Coriobacteriia bacterium]